jgi:hypothetical protein
MKNMLMLVIFIVTLAVLAGCGENSDESDELKMLEVDFELPDTADVDETIELKATVTYGNEKVIDADQMEFEYWEEGNRDDSTFLQAENNGDGTYTAEVSFDKDGVFELYAHTTAEELHTMPKRSIVIGTGSDDS